MKKGAAPTTKKENEHKEIVVKKTPSLSQKVYRASLQGAVGAVVAAGIAAFTDPVVNRVLVQRVGVVQAIKQTNMKHVSKYFRTTLTTNMLKFPMYEVLSLLSDSVPVPPSVRGLATGALFTTATLPITNYRYSKSVGEPISFSSLYKAYPPTLVRDMIYGVARTKANQMIAKKWPTMKETPRGQFWGMFGAVMAACVASAPGNELRGYYLQPKNKRLPVKDFFQVGRFARSTSLGAIVMALSLGAGVVISKPLHNQLTCAANKVMPKKQHQPITPPTPKKN
ncbi:membrane carrier 4 [Pelomyxa schiedti]|nr:membrane carrier 4 [Pelomyxa schiedti]